MYSLWYSCVSIILNRLKYCRVGLLFARCLFYDFLSIFHVYKFDVWTKCPRTKCHHAKCHCGFRNKMYCQGCSQHSMLPGRLCFVALMSRYLKICQTLRSKNYSCSQRCKYRTSGNYETDLVMFCVLKRVCLEFSFV